MPIIGIEIGRAMDKPSLALKAVGRDVLNPLPLAARILSLCWLAFMNAFALSNLNTFILPYLYPD